MVWGSCPAEIIRLLERGVPFDAIDTVPQTTILRAKPEIPKNKNWEDLWLNSHERCSARQLAFAANFKHVEQQSNKVHTKRILQEVGERVLVVNPPYPPMTENEIDTSFDLPYTRMPHPGTKRRGCLRRMR